MNIIDLIMFFASMIISGVLVYLTAVLKASDTRDRRMGSLVVVCVVTLIWTVLNAATMIIDPAYFPYVYPVKVVFVTTLPYVLFWFILNFANSWFAGLKSLTAAVILVPFLDCIGILTNPLHHLYFINYDYPVPPKGLLFTPHVAMQAVFILFGYVILCRYIAANFRQRPLLILTGVGTLLPYIINMLYSVGYFEKFGLNHDITPFGVFFTIIIFAYSSRRAEMFHFKSDIITSVFDLLHNIIIIINREGYIVEANAVLYEFMKDFKLQLGKTTIGEFSAFLRDKVSSRSPENILDLLNVTVKNNFSGEIEVLGESGNVRTLSLNWIVRKSRGEILSYVINLADVSEYRAMISEIKEKNIQLTEMKEMAEEASYAKSTFLAQMSHEIRTPMNAIIGMAELALRDDMSDDARNHVQTVKQAGANLLAIINDILDFSKIERGKLEIIPSDYLLSSLMNDIISIIRMRAFEAELDFTVNIDDKIPDALFGDEARIRQVLLNLLGNAVKFTEDGYISLNVTGKQIDDSHIQITFVIEDSGIGIKKEEINDVFDAYNQSSQVKEKSIEGTGLGLAITRNFVNMMSGSISVSSELGKGSAFTVTLPQKIRSPGAIAEVINPSEKKVLVYTHRDIYAVSIIKTLESFNIDCMSVSNDDEFCGKLLTGQYNFVFISARLFENMKRAFAITVVPVKVILLTGFGEAVSDRSMSILSMPIYSMPVANVLNGAQGNIFYYENDKNIMVFTAPEAKVLLVDDINTNLKVAEGLLRPYKMQISICNSGMDAIESVMANHYDLVFMDHKMPVMDGVEATKRIRELDSEKYYSQVPIIALTANAVTGMREMFLESGFDDFLSKPIDTMALNAILRKWIPKDKHRSRAEEKNDENSNAQKSQDINAPGTFEAVKPAKPTETIKIEGVDTEKGIMMSGGTIDFYIETLSVFHEDGLERVEKIKECLEENNIALYVTYVHALKSASANIGAGNLSETAKSLETAGNNADINYIETHNGKFMTDLESLLNSIEKSLADLKANETKEPAVLDNEKFRIELENLKTALNDMNAGVIGKAEKNLRNMNPQGEMLTAIENISKNILFGEYDDAVDLINGLLK